jgi:hypothetical protein
MREIFKDEQEPLGIEYQEKYSKLNEDLIVSFNLCFDLSFINHYRKKKKSLSL